MKTQKLLSMLSLSSDTEIVTNSNISNNTNSNVNNNVTEQSISKQRWRSLISDRRAHRSCTDDYSSLRTESDRASAGSSILSQPIEFIQYIRSRKSSSDAVNTDIVSSDIRNSANKLFRRTSFRPSNTDSVFVDSDSAINISTKRERLLKHKQVEKFYENRSKPTTTTITSPQSPYQGNLSIEHFQFDLYSTVDDEYEGGVSSTVSTVSGDICGQLSGYVHYLIEIEQLEVKLNTVSIDYLKLPKREPVNNMFVRIQLLPHKNDSFISSLIRCDNSVGNWNSSWVTSASFEECQQGVAQFLVRCLVKGATPRHLGVCEVDLKKFDIINGESFQGNVYNGPVTDELGEIQISLMYAPDLKQMTMTIGKLRNLVKKDKDFFKKPDCFVKMSLYHGKKLIKSKKTAIKRATYNPQFNESFQFELSGSIATASSVTSPTNSTTTTSSIAATNLINSNVGSSGVFVVVSVYDHHSASKDDCLGRLIFSSNRKSSSSLQTEHLAETMGCSWTTVTRWHSIISKDKCSSISSNSSEDNK